MISSRELWSLSWRGAKTLFFLANLFFSLLRLCAPPFLIVLLDLLLPSAILAAANPPEFKKLPFLRPQITSFQFRTSLLDLPAISIARSMLITCFYLCCDGRGVYVWFTIVCGLASVGYVVLKGVVMFGGRRVLLFGGVKEGELVEALLLSSVGLAVAHVAAAYRSCGRGRRKLVVYKFDIEAVLVYNNEFPNYHKIALSK